MKSEKAKQRLYESFTFNSDIGIDRKAAIEAVELAEQEAEERMRAKAIEAYCIGCICYETGVCALGPDKCATKSLFIQKLNENGED